ncbi:MAG TPA: CPBP family intramembrane glutamic endopeptidase [Acidothermaceae bacterium]
MTSPTTPVVDAAALEQQPRRRSGHRGWTAVAAVELAIAVGCVVFDQTVPTLPLLAVAALGLAARRQGVGAIGVRALTPVRRVAGQVLAFTGVWTLLQLAVFLPLAEHLTGTRQDVSDFAGLEGNLGKLFVLLGLSWTLAAAGEELVFRGWIPTRITDLVGAGRVGVALAVLVSSALFALIHTEQGVVGVAATFFDAIFFSGLRLRYGSVWASWLAHGLNNTFGLVAFFLVGPVAGLW